MSDSINEQRCPFIHPSEGVRCEKHPHSDAQHVVSCYWTGGDSLRWAYPVAANIEPAVS